MASNFRIRAHRHKNHLHLKLQGDFDGSSAYELIHKLEKLLTGPSSTVFIHTQDLQTLYPFGLAVFQSNFPMAQFHAFDFIFLGPKGEKLAPWKDPAHEQENIRFLEEAHGQNNRNIVLQAGT